MGYAEQAIHRNPLRGKDPDSDHGSYSFSNKYFCASTAQAKAPPFFFFMSLIEYCSIVSNGVMHIADPYI